MSGGAPLPDASVLIVAYNSAAVIETCLRSISAACQRHTVEVLMVDNGDGNGGGAAEALVRERFPHVRIVESRGNVGFAAGNNLLAQHAAAPMLLLLNPDMELCAGAIDALLDGAARHPEGSVWGGVTLNRDGQPDSGNAIAIPSMPELISVALGRSLVGSRPIEGVTRDAEVATVSGGFMMVSRTAWDAASGLDEAFFLYCEEIDLFHRLRQAGRSIWRIAGARGYHDVGHGEPVSPRRLLFRAAGTMQFVRKHWSRPWHPVVSFVTRLAAVERYLAGKLLGRFNPRLKAMGYGYREVALRPELWRYGYDPDRGLLARLREGDAR